ncbi:MAG: alpha/beta hydrolase [Acidobacteria bacterium]|nr:alpha/beta hydrolase [Acidobacteriota bacterium]
MQAKLSLWFSLLLVSSLPLAAAPLRVIRDIPYYTGPGAHPRRHLLDLYLPEGVSRFPLVMFIYGGSWSRGDKDDRGGAYSLIGQRLVQRDIGFAIINYRLSPSVQHPEHVRDVARALAWLFRNSERYGWNSNRLFLLGHSAGAHLASLVTVDDTYLAEQKLKPGIVNGVIALSGVYDLTLTGISGQAIYEPVFTAEPSRLKAASPALLVSRKAPPFLLGYAEKDYPSADFQVRRFKKTLERFGGTAETLMVPKRTHVTIVVGLIEEEDPLHKAVLNFIQNN